MNFYTALFLTITVIVVAKMVTSIVSTSAQKHRNPRGGERLDQLERQLAQMNERLQNLETIVTSKDYQLHREFEDLERER